MGTKRGPMIKLNVTAPKRQHEYIERVANRKGLPKAEVVRRIIDDHISREDEKNNGKQG